MKVRMVRFDDLTDLVTLRRAFWPHLDVSDHQRILRRRFESSARFATLVLVNSDEQLCGFVELMRDPDLPGEPNRVLLQAVFVAPAMRRCGGATQLLEAAQRWAHGRGATSLYCDVPLDDGQARDMLRFLGFIDVRHWMRATRPVAEAPEGAIPRAPEQTLNGSAVSKMAAQQISQPMMQSTSQQIDEHALVMSEKSRSPLALITNIVLFITALVAFANTNIYSSDLLRGMLLPLLDVLLVLYFLFLFMFVRYRKRADSSARLGRLFGVDD